MGGMPWRQRLAIGMAGLAVGGACGAGADAQSGNAAGEAAGSNVVVEWNIVALRTSAAAPFDPPWETRSLAIVQGAVFDAVNSITGGFRPYLDLKPAPEDASTAAAVAAAAHDTLVALYADQRAVLDDAYATALADVPDGSGKQAGIAAGQEAASLMLADRADDRPGEAGGEGPSPAVGIWRPTLPSHQAPLRPEWGQVTPWALSQPAHFRPSEPYALTSDEYAADFDEVKAVGSATSTVRTAEQSATARFWAATPSQLWNQPVHQLATAKRLTIVQVARLLALTNFAIADGAIAAWDAKFTFHQWRPITGIHEAAADHNPATTADPEWAPFLPTPPFPDYVCGHSTAGAAAQGVLEHFFGRRPGATMSITSPSDPNSTHRYSSFRAIEDEVVDARVWGGAHWRTSCEVGRSVGLKVGRYVATHALLPD